MTRRDFSRPIDLQCSGSLPPLWGRVRVGEIGLVLPPTPTLPRKGEGEESNGPPNLSVTPESVRVWALPRRLVGRKKMPSPPWLRVRVDDKWTSSKRGSTCASLIGGRVRGPLPAVQPGGLGACLCALDECGH